MSAVDAIRAEYRLGYWEGVQLGKQHLADSRSDLRTATMQDLRSWIPRAAYPLSRAFALGNLRGYRHSTWAVR